MKFSKLTDYSVLILTELSKSDGDSLAASALAKKSNVPEPTVSKVLKILSRAGLVKAQRGAQGGYVLSRDISAISVFDVLIAIEGPLTMTECASGHDDVSCSLESICALNGRWGVVNKAIENTLNNISLAQLIRPNGKKEFVKLEGQKAYV